MYSVELYARLRRACHVEGLSERVAARLFGVDRKTVSKILGAIAQAQRLKAETEDAIAAACASEIESTLKGLNSLSEKLMQLAQAEGARLRMDEITDLRPILRIIQPVDGLQLVPDAASRVVQRDVNAAVVMTRQLPPRVDAIS